MKLVWKFLEKREGWKWRQGRKLDATWLYYHPDKPQETFPNQEEVCGVWCV